MNTIAYSGHLKANKIEAQFIPFQRSVWKARRLTDLKRFDEIETKLTEFREHIDTYKVSIGKSEILLRKQKRYLMTLTLNESEKRQFLIADIDILEKKCHEAKIKLAYSEKRYQELNQKLLGQA